MFISLHEKWKPFIHEYAGAHICIQLAKYQLLIKALSIHTFRRMVRTEFPHESISTISPRYSDE
jgi:hypothetical protein